MPKPSVTPQVDGDTYKVVSRKGKQGSVAPDGSYTPRVQNTPPPLRARIPLASLLLYIFMISYRECREMVDRVHGS